MLENIHGYDEIEFAPAFLKSNLGRQLLKEYDVLLWGWSYRTGVALRHTSYSTSRELLCCKAITIAPFYYLNFLIEQNPLQIYDLGCGCNLFKKHITNIIGVDPQHAAADLKDFVDDDFVKHHQNYFESVFSINALHFIPLKMIRHRVEQFISMIAPGGRGFLVLNMMRMLELDIETVNSLIGTELINIKKFISEKENRLADFLLENCPILEHKENRLILEHYVRVQLDNLPVDILCADICFERLDTGIDGNIRLVIQKP